MWGRGFWTRSVWDRDEPFVEDGLVDPTGSVVTVGARCFVATLPVPDAVFRIFATMEVFFVYSVPSVESAGAVQSGGGDGL